MSANSAESTNGVRLRASSNCRSGMVMCQPNKVVGVVDRDPCGGLLRSPSTPLDTWRADTRAVVGQYDLTAYYTCYSLSFRNSDRLSIVIVPRPLVAS